MNIDEKCRQTVTDSKIVLRDPQKNAGSKVILLNPDCLEVEKVMVDGCVFQNEKVKRCDWMVNAEWAASTILLELKGTDVKGAYEQLKSTHQNLSFMTKSKVRWIISHSGSPSDRQRFELLKREARKAGATLLIDKSGKEYNIKE